MAKSIPDRPTKITRQEFDDWIKPSHQLGSVPGHYIDADHEYDIAVAGDDVAIHPCNNASSHTPGPWLVTKNGLADSSIHLVDLSPIAHVGDGVHDGFPEQAEANARLIAAAPKLLQALENLVNSLECDMEADIEHQISDCGGSENCTLCEAKEEISEARGE